MKDSPLLDISHLVAFYGSSQIIFDLSLQVDSGEIVVLLGRNGMGKTTLLHSISNLGPQLRG